MPSHRREAFCCLFTLLFRIFFGMLKRRLRLGVRIRSSPLYPRSGGASSANGKRMESFVRRIPGIQSVFMFVCLIQGQSLPIYDCHL